MLAVEETFHKALEQVLSRHMPHFEGLIDVEQLTAGASQETYRISLRCAGGERLLALRRSPPAAEASSAVGSISLETEARLLQLATDNGIPGPRVHYVLAQGDDLGAGFLMDWLVGETMGQRILRAESLADIRPRLARECGEILGRIHALDYEAAGLAADLPRVDPEALVEETWGHYRDLNVPVPMIDYCYRWLMDHAPRESRTTLVHGDFRNGNLMITPQGINAVLDWELAHVGDPVRDLGWICVNSWRFGRHDKVVGGFGDVQDLLAGYRETSGVDISLEALKYWQVFGSFWWAMATLQMANAWRTGDAPSLERPVIGRRSSEAQMDCVNLLIPGSSVLPDFDDAGAKGTQLPMPEELLTSVADFLKDEVARELQGRSAFLARVAANSLGIAVREIQCGSALGVDEKRRLASLLGTQDTSLPDQASLDTLRWTLVQELRNGMPLDTPGLAAHLRQTVAGQLAIDQPGYPALHQR